jgi:hypothetical protein
VPPGKPHRPAGRLIRSAICLRAAPNSLKLKSAIISQR